MEWERMSSNNSYQSRASTDEKIGSLFQPDTLVVEQYLEHFRRRIPVEPEKRLMLAVLEDAINCFQDNLFARNRKSRKLFDDAEEWILDRSADRVFSFESICEVLGFSPEYLRQGLLRWKEKKLAKQPNTETWERKKMVG
jgi:hypothetical protein